MYILYSYVHIKDLLAHALYMVSKPLNFSLPEFTMIKRNIVYTFYTYHKVHKMQLLPRLLQFILQNSLTIFSPSIPLAKKVINFAVNTEHSDFKGSVSQDIRGVKSSINREVWLSGCVGRVVFIFSTRLRLLICEILLIQRNIIGKICHFFPKWA
jgi:hypothetical protein